MSPACMVPPATSMFSKRSTLPGPKNSSRHSRRSIHLTVRASSEGVVVFSSVRMVTSSLMLLVVTPDRSTSIAARSLYPVMGEPELPSNTVILAEVLAGKAPSRYATSHFWVRVSGRVMGTEVNVPR